jgi:enamine deaminase RidA (YjgF/YER057c/UK114 family)
VAFINPPELHKQPSYSRVITVKGPCKFVLVRRVFTLDVDKLREAMKGAQRPENPQAPPTSTVIGVTRLSHPDFLIEMDLIAVTDA